MNRRQFIAGLMAVSLAGCTPRRHQVSVGTKNFTEQLLLGEILAQSLEAAGSGPAERRFYLAGSYICHQALLAGRIALSPQTGDVVRRVGDLSCQIFD